MDPPVPDELGVLAKRIEFVDQLADHPHHKADLVEAMDHSRSTVNRAVKELEDAGFVERVTEGYVATQAGRLAAERYRAFLADGRALLAAREVLAGIPHDWAVPAALVTDASVAVEDPAYRLFEALAETFDAADRVVALLPRLFDSRHLRLCHSRLRHGGPAVTLQAPGDVLDDVAREFPYLWEDLRDDPGFEARSGEVPPFGLVVSFVDGEPGSVTVVTATDGQVSGFLRSAHPEVTEWGHDLATSFEGDPDDVPPASGTDALAADLSPLTGDRLPADLRSQGFVRVDDRYFDRREPTSPVTAWRAGLELPEVAAGYAVERSPGPDHDVAGTPRRPGDDGSLTGTLLDRLQGGANVALIGPPGSGKSTVCKSVACRWHDAVGGTVLYRESGSGRHFESVGILETTIERVDGPLLVVVEDAVRPEANAAFEAMRTVSGREDVAFLVDAREDEWRDPDEFPVDAHLRAFRREAVETVTMPPLDEADCRRLVERVESVTGEHLDVSPEDLLADLRRSAGGERGATPGLVSLLFHRLTRYLDPLAADAETSLDEDVDRVRRDLADAGEVALDAGIMVNLLNASGVGVYPAYVHAVPGADGAHSTVREAIERLEGHVLFPDRGSAGTPYRGVNDLWSARFLTRLVEVEGEAAAARRFGRCVTALLELADDPALRERAARESDGDARGLDPIVAAPVEWAEETVEAVFALGREYPKLAPLFGTTDESSIALPAACSDGTVARCTEWRGRMYAAAGELDRAETEFQRLDEIAEAGTLPPDEADRARLESLLGHADVARRRGDLETAADNARTGRDVARETDDRLGEARARLALGGIASDRGEPGRAEEHFEACLASFEDLEAPLWTARTLDELGDVARARADYDDAVEHFERALDTYRSVGDRRGEAAALGDLGKVMNRRGDYEAAREKFLRALEVARELGDRSMVADVLKLLGDAANSRGDYDRAREHYRRAIEAAEAVGDRHGVARAQRELGIVAGKRDMFDRAGDHLREALEAYEAVGDRHGIARIHYNLGTVAGKQGDYEEARDRYERALEGFEAVGNQHAIVGVHHNLGKTAKRRGSYDEAREHFDRALEGYEDVGDEHGIARAHSNLGVVATERGAYDRADDHFDRALEGYEDVGDEHGIALVDRYRGTADMLRGEYDRAADRLERALERSESIDARHGIARAHLRLGTLARNRGDAEAAREHAGRALEIAEEVGSPGDVARVKLELGRIALARGDRDAAERLAVEARDAFEEREIVHRLAGARRLLGRVAAEADDVDPARERFAAALETFEEIGSFGEALETLEYLVEVCRSAGDGQAAEEWYDRAEELADEAPPGAADHHGGWIEQSRTEPEAD